MISFYAVDIFWQCLYRNCVRLAGPEDSLPTPGPPFVTNVSPDPTRTSRVKLRANHVLRGCISLIPEQGSADHVLAEPTRSRVHPRVRKVRSGGGEGIV